MNAQQARALVETAQAKVSCFLPADHTLLKTATESLPDGSRLDAILFAVTLLERRHQ